MPLLKGWNGCSIDRSSPKSQAQRRKISKVSPEFPEFPNIRFPGDPAAGKPDESVVHATQFAEQLRLGSGAVVFLSEVQIGKLDDTKVPGHYRFLLVGCF
jgi:hypothetical protein